MPKEEIHQEDDFGQSITIAEEINLICMAFILFLLQMYQTEQKYTESLQNNWLATLCINFNFIADGNAEFSLLCSSINILKDKRLDPEHIFRVVGEFMRLPLLCRMQNLLSSAIDYTTPQKTETQAATMVLLAYACLTYTSIMYSRVMLKPRDYLPQYMAKQSAIYTPSQSPDSSRHSPLATPQYGIGSFSSFDDDNSPSPDRATSFGSQGFVYTPCRKESLQKLNSFDGWRKEMNEDSPAQSPLPSASNVQNNAKGLNLVSARRISFSGAE